MIPTFVPTGRDQPAKHAGGRQAAEAAHHRAQHARFEGHAPAHLAARPTLLVRAVADAEHCVCSLRTAVGITLSTATSTVSDVSNDLPKSSNGQRSTQCTPSAVVQAALLMRLHQKKWGSNPSAGWRHRGHGRQLSFRQPSKARWRRKNGSGPVRAYLKVSAHGEDEEAN